MSRTYLNHEPNHNATQRTGRRQKFRTKFEELPLGMFDVQKLAKKARLARLTAIAFLVELETEGFAVHRYTRRCFHGVQYQSSVWSRIK